MKYLIFSLVLFADLSFSIELPDLNCRSSPEIDSINQLETLYSNSETVFLANVEIDDSSTLNPIIWKYELIKPVLKGIVEDRGYLKQEIDRCVSISAIPKGVYLVFWKNVPEPISDINTVPVVYGGGNVYEEWVLKWAKSKT